MHPKILIPPALRETLRPSWQRLQRRWRESSLSPKPPEWAQAREAAHREESFEALYRMAGEAFGITQVPFEIETLLERVRALEPKVVVEIGTHKGGNSFLFCHALRSPELLVGLDLNVQNAAKLRYFTRPGQRYVALHGNSQVVEQRRRLERVLGGRSVDFLFIDGDHSYDGVRADYELYAPLVRPGGLIAFHDIIPDHGTRFGRDTGCWTGEVFRFWGEVMQRYVSVEELVDDPDQDGFGIGVLHVAEAAA